MPARAEYDEQVELMLTFQKFSFLTKIDIFEKCGSKALILSVEKNVFFRRFFVFFCIFFVTRSVSVGHRGFNIQPKNQGSRGVEKMASCVYQKKTVPLHPNS